MYGDALAINSEKMPKQPFLKQAHDDLSNLLTNNRDMISSIQNRLHLIIDKRSGGLTESNENAPKKDDAYQNLTDDISFLRENNRMLDNVLSHLSEII